MQASQIPSLIPLAFAANGTKNEIPEASQIGITNGAASLNDGFPPLTMTPVAAGGIPPAGADFNGIFYMLSALLRWQNAGGQFPWNDAFATDANVGGYPSGGHILRADGTGFWLNTADNNETNPDATDGSAANWVPGYNYGDTTVSTLTNANVTLTPAQSAKGKIILSGTLTANVQVIFPAWHKQWEVVNNTTGSFSVTAITAGGTGVVLPAGHTFVYGDGTNIIFPPMNVAAPTQSTHAAQFGQITPAYSINSIPATQAAAGGAAAIMVIEAGEIWPWVSTAYYTGYRSVNIGSPIASAYVTPRAHEVDAVGGTLSKTTYARLWAFAQENGLVVASGSWVAGALNFVDLGSGNFQAPDLRNMFIRLAAGATDPDTANARALGSYKADTYRSHSHPIPASPVAAAGGEDIAVLGTTGSGANTSANGTAETAPKHVALYPRIVI